MYGKRVKITDGPLYQSPFTYCKHALTYITRKSMLISRSYVLFSYIAAHLGHLGLLFTPKTPASRGSTACFTVRRRETLRLDCEHIFDAKQRPIAQ